MPGPSSTLNPAPYTLHTLLLRVSLQMVEIKNTPLTRLLLHASFLHASYTPPFTRLLHVQMAEIKNLGVTRQSHYKLLINPSHPLILSLNKVSFAALVGLVCCSCFCMVSSSAGACDAIGS
jgi:hypothetical protein